MVVDDADEEVLVAIPMLWIESMRVDVLHRYRTAIETSDGFCYLDIDEVADEYVYGVIPKSQAARLAAEMRRLARHG